MSKHEDKKAVRRERELELAGPVIVVFTVLTLIAFLLPLRPKTSLRERRTLKEFPTFTVVSLLNGDYFDGITAWFSDTFPGREAMMEVSDRMDALHGLNRTEVALTQTGKKNDNADLDALLQQAEASAAAGQTVPDAAVEEPAKTDGNLQPALPAGSSSKTEIPTPTDPIQTTPVPDLPSEPADPDEVIEAWEGLKGEDEMNMYGDLVVIDGNILSRIGFDQYASDHHAALMNQAGDALAAKGIRFFNLPAPTSVGILLSSEMVEKINTSDQSKVLRYMFAQEGENVHKVNVFNNLLQHNDEYIYYHTDHHWTGLGAYYAYETFCMEAGFDPVPISEYREWNMGEFIGSNSYNVNSRNLKKDEMIAYVPPGNENIHMEITGYPDATSVIVDETDASPHIKYNCFINGDNPITVITNDSLPDAPDCLVIKDSYGNPFTVYLAQHYHKIYVLDYRQNFLPVSTLAEQYGAEDVVLVQSISVSQTLNAQYLLNNIMK